MNLFYTSPEHIHSNQLTLIDQEAAHAIKVMRHREGDTLYVTDGEGTLYKGQINSVTKNEVNLIVLESKKEEKARTRVIIAMGILKKRDRMEVAAEKCVELGADGFILFKSDHSEKTNVRLDRIENTMLSAMKQSLRLWLPKAEVLDSVDELIQSKSEDSQLLLADQDSDETEITLSDDCNELILVAGPEGGLSEREIQLLKKSCAGTVQLGSKRLRAETAAIALCFKAGLPK